MTHTYCQTIITEPKPICLRTFWGYFVLPSRTDLAGTSQLFERMMMRSGGEKKNQLLNFDVPFTPRCSDVSKRGRLAERGERVGGHPSLCSQEAEHQGRELLSRSHSSGCCASRIKRDVTKYWASASGHAVPVECWWLTTSAQGQRSQTGEPCFKGSLPNNYFLTRDMCGVSTLWHQTLGALWTGTGTVALSFQLQQRCILLISVIESEKNHTETPAGRLKGSISARCKP